MKLLVEIQVFEGDGINHSYEGYSFGDGSGQNRVDLGGGDGSGIDPIVYARQKFGGGDGDEQGVGHINGDGGVGYGNSGIGYQEGKTPGLQ